MRRAWRHGLNRDRHRRRAVLRRVMAAALVLEGVFMVHGPAAARGERLRIVNRREEYCAEWIRPGEDAGAGSSAADIYGIRLRPGSWEIELYHREQELKY